MDPKTIFTKTSKGLSESTGKTRTLPREIREVLKEVDGTSSVEDLASVLGMPGDRLRETLGKLATEDYIHEFVPPIVADDEFDLGPEPSRTTVDPLTETTIGTFLRAGEEQTRSQPAGQQLARQQQTEDQARRQAEEQARKQAEEAARREAEDELRRVAERARQAEEHRAKREAERQARREAKAQARKEAHERALRKAERHAGHATLQRIEPVLTNTVQPGTESRTEKKADPAGEEHMQASAKVAGRRKSKRSTKPADADADAAHERAVGIAAEPVVSIDTGEPYNPPRGMRLPWPFGGGGRKIKWGKPVAAVASIALIAGATMAFTTSYDGKAVQFETQASAQLGQQVKVGKVRLGLLPQPHWRLEDVSIGKEGQIKVARIDAVTSFGSLFGDQTVYRTVVLVSPVMTEEGLGWLAFSRGASPKDTFRFEEISAVGARLASDTIELPPFSFNASFYDDGSWKTATLDSDDKTFHATLRPQRNAVHVDLIADAFTPPFGTALKFDTFHASGTATRTEMTLPKFGGKMLGGFVDGGATLKWEGGWKLEGNVKITQMDTPPFAPQLFEGGKLDGSASYVMQAPAAGQLLPSLRKNGKLNGNLTVRNGALLGVNLASILRGITAGGRSPLTLVEGEISQDQGITRLRNLQADAGALSLGGSVDVDSKDRLNGHFSVELKTTTRQTRAFMGLGGTLDAPQFHR